MEFKRLYPTGDNEILLAAAQYSFNWQLEFVSAQPKMLRKGTRLEYVPGFDRLQNNKFNPDPSKEVRWGDQSWEEMMIGYFEIGFNPTLDLPDMMGGNRRQLE